MEAEFLFNSRRSNVMARRGMVATSQPLATVVGLDVLKAGGNAADAAVAAAAMMCVVEPISNGIGGDCFVLYFDAASGKVSALNGSGRSAEAASVDALREAGYRTMPLFTGAAVTVPGAVRAWADLLERHGSLAMADLLKPAIQTAEDGFPVSEWIAATWRWSEAKLRRDPTWESGDLDNGPEQPSGAELLLDGRAPRYGELMRLSTMAETLRGIAADGPAFIYEGEFAEQLAAHAQRYGGCISAEDLRAHKSTWVEPISCEYRGVRLYECPPNGQGLAAILATNLAAGFDLAEMDEPERVHHMIECMRLAFADARHWISDPDHAAPGYAARLERLCSPLYAQSRRGRIHPTRAAEKIPTDTATIGDDTIYLSVIDEAGNAASLIQSCYMGTGTGLVVPGTGVSLQNRGAGFVLDPSHPNVLAPRKRPYHTIIPALTTREGALHASFGVMGGYMQPQAHFQMMVNMLDLEHSPQRALDAPRWQLAGPGAPLGAGEEGGMVFIEEGWETTTLTELIRRGHRLLPFRGLKRIMFGGGQIITRDGQTGVLTAGSDPRKDGCAIGW